MAIIDNGSSVFVANLHTGNATDDTDITTGIAANFIWFKQYNATRGLLNFDSVRGVQKQLNSNSNALSYTEATSLQAFNSDGFTVGTSNSCNGVNGGLYVTWNFKITSGVFDIQTWTGTGSNRTISHNLSAVPTLFIVKEITGSVNDWTVYYGDPTDALQLNEVNSTSDAATRWNDTAPTASVFSLGSGSVGNRNNSTYIGYFFADSSVSKATTYRGNGTAQQFIHLGFKPAWVMIKGVSGSGSNENWSIYDNARTPNNVINSVVYANANNAQGTSSDIDFLSNGVCIRRATGLLNDAAVTYVILAMAEEPFVSSEDNGSIPATGK